MKLIDYTKYTKKWSPRGTIMLLVVEAAVTGFFLSATMYEALRGHGIWAWIMPLVGLFEWSGYVASHADRAAQLSAICENRSS